MTSVESQAKPSLASEVKQSLFNFINKNIPTANVSAIDDIVLSYVVTIIEEASRDSCFDVEGFMEMMDAYVPDFSNIDEGQVCTWVLEVEADLIRQKNEGEASCSGASSPGSSGLVVAMPSLSAMLPPPNTKTERNRSRSDSEGEEHDEHVVYECEEYTQQCEALREMFPNTSLMEIKHCVSIADGDVELAAATLLHRRENGQALTAVALPTPRTSVIDDVTLKYRIIERYSYVDEDSGNKEHRPLAPKMEPKKLVRYRDGKIVSLKGERYTEVPKPGAEEENLKKPKKHCP
ncbi:CUE domain-containing protein 2 [Epargyreus clarus]|uniref:CUE domain-containing protein 2 n=1 Tax=Epargyreus clarus TaxID=520877 RepID=UPI003C2DA23B